MARGLVRVELRGRADGDATGVTLRIVSLADAPVRICVRRGTRFVPDGARP